jgi:hypothetical protein
MARYKEYDYSQGKFIPIHFDKQILPGTFEYTLHYRRLRISNPFLGWTDSDYRLVRSMQKRTS